MKSSPLQMWRRGWGEFLEVKSKKSKVKNDMSTGLQCPIDHVTINEYKARVSAFFVLGLAATYLFSGVWPILVFLAVDFLLRSGNWSKYSPIGLLSDAVIKQFNIGVKLTDRGPKRFAAKMGLVFVLTILALDIFQQDLAAQLLTLVLITFASLESFAGFCAGCYVYTYGKLLIGKKS